MQEEDRWEGLHFKKQYLRDAQLVFSRVQHHVHRKTKEGKYEPLRACANKKRGKTFIKKDEICKHDFPRKALPQETVLICRELAKKFNLKVSGRCNMLGTF